MDSPQTSLHALTTVGQCGEEQTDRALDSFIRSIGGMGSEGSSGVSSGASETASRDSSVSMSSKRLGSAESASSGSSVFMDSNSNVDTSHYCTSCMTKDSGAVARCFDCNNFLCANCVMAHQFILRYEGHHIVILGEIVNGSKSGNESEDLNALSRVIAEGNIKAAEISKAKNLEATSTRLSSQYRKAVDEVNETYQFYATMLQDRKGEIMMELEQAFGSKQVALSVYGRKARETADKIYQVTDFGDRLMKHACASEVLLFKKPIEARLHEVLAYMPDLNMAALTELEFISNFQAIQAGVKNQFGYMKTNQEVDGSKQQPPICRPMGASSSIPVEPKLAAGSSAQFQDSQENSSSAISPISKVCEEMTKSTMFKHNPMTGMARDPLDMEKQAFDKKVMMPINRFASTPIKPAPTSLLGPLFNTPNQLPSLFQGSYKEDITTNPYDKWADGSDNLFSGLAVGPSNQLSAPYRNSPTASLQSSFPILGLSSNIHSSSFNSFSGLSPEFTSPTNMTSVVYPSPAKSHIKRQKMIYHCKFGEFGILEDQFTEPSGVAVNNQNDIIVADTNNHKIKIFDKEGRFKFQFGEVGKRDGQLLYPNRVAVFKDSGDIVVTERSPTHQVQIYTQYGQFIRKFGANILQHPRGVCVDNKGRVIVVECKVMRVIIFDQNGNLLKKFGCSQYLHFPNGVVVNDQQEIFISDNRAHCVKVFSYEGNFLKQIGGEGITNYPIGVGINAKGEITIADNHNNFNLTVFSQDGLLISALESKVKHAQCYDVALMDDGSVILASKDFKLYIYRYIQMPPLMSRLEM